MSDALRILVVDDQRPHADVLAELLKRARHEVDVAGSFPEAQAALERGRYDLVLTDLVLGAHRGTEILALARALPSPPEVMVVSGVGSIEDAVEAMQLGAVHYFTKPLNVEEVRKAVSKAAERIRGSRAPEGGAAAPPSTEAGASFEGIIGRSAAMLRIFDTVRRIATANATVLIQGENGTGKELVAKAIHNLSSRRDGPFVALNCAALSEGILESELFGHEKGAFTGAARAREGMFEFANRGTLFLDEVGDMPLSLQVKLLRVIQEREITRVGSNRTIKVDVRLIAATNKDLEKEIQAGTFREDLYWRLKVVSIEMPPLRERRDDIPLLVEAFVKEFSRRHERPVLGVAPETMAVLTQHAWPGNVRQLQNTLETMVLLAPGPQLEPSDLPPEMTRETARAGSTALVSSSDLANYTLDQWEKELIKLQLARNDGNRAKVAKALGISERTLYRKLREYGLT